MPHFTLTDAELQQLAERLADLLVARLSGAGGAGFGPAGVSGSPLTVYTEPEAAEQLKLRRHQLRDIRLREEISFSRGPKGCIRYTADDLKDYLNSRREERR